MKKPSPPPPGNCTGNKRQRADDGTEELASLRAELEAERSARQRLERALAASSEGIWEWQPDTDRIFLSAALCSHLRLGESGPGLSGSDYLALVHPEDGDSVRDNLRAMLHDGRDGEIREQAYRIRCVDGAWTWVRVRAIVDRGTDGRVRSITGMHADISTLKQTQSALRNVQDRYHMLYEAAPVALVLWNSSGQVIEWNRRAEALFGWTLEEVIGRRIAEQMIDAGDRAAYAAMAKQTLASGGIGQISTNCLTKAGQHLRCAWSCIALRTNGKLVGLLALALDTTSHHVAEQQLRENESAYRTLVETSPDGVLLVDARGTIQRCNQRAASLFGFEHAGEMLGSTSRETLGEEFADSLFVDVAGTADFIQTVEAVLPRRDGSRFMATISHTAVTGSDGCVTGIVLYIHDVTQRRAIESELNAYRQDLEQLVEARTAELALARNTLSQILDNSPVPTFVLDAKHCITHWNRACEKIIGKSATEMVGTANQWSAFYPAVRPVLADLVMFNDSVTIDSLYSGKARPSPIIPGAFEAEDYFPLPGRWLYFTATVLRDAAGKVVGAIETLQDTSDRKEAEIALQEAKAEAETAARAKAEFLANMSHEIRTPLNAIIGLVHLLQRSELTAKQREHLLRLRASGDMLLQLINDILDFSKIEAGQMSIERAPFVLDDILENLSAMVGLRAREKSLELHFVLENDVPQRLVGDPLRTTQVLVNLLSNAVKFTDSGQILVFISIAERTSAGVRLEFAVQDTGIGISPEQQKRLFRAFSQADASTTRKYGGTGLGLTICARLVEMMGGSISLSSEPGVGSTFLFDLPFSIEECSGEIASPMRNCRTLVVDDNPVARMVLSRLLEKLGCRAEAVGDGEAALQAVARTDPEPFGVVFVDWNMPGMNGVELAQRLRSETARPPRVVVVTALGQSEAEAAFAGARVDALLLKPVSATGLATVLRELDATDSPAPQSRPVPVGAARLAGLRVLLVDDVAMNRLIASEILEDEEAHLGEAENGEIAIRQVQNGGPWDVVLMDVQMPVMNGLDATRAIRADARFADLPILAMTASTQDEERRRCFDAGMNGFLTKPIEPEAVIAALAAISRNRPPSPPEPPVREAPAAASPPPGVAAFPALPGIDTVEGLKRMMNKPAFYEKMLKSFHDRFVGAPATIHGLLAAGRIEDAEREAHSAKGLSASISANRLRDRALALETAIKGGNRNIDPEIAAFAEALGEVLDGLRAQFGWSAAQ